jgi:hypothetical protein
MTDSEYIASIEKELDELRTWKRQYAEASELWDALKLGDNDQVTAVIMVAKVVDFEKGTVNISSSASDSCDWIDQLGLYEAWRTMNFQTPIVSDEDDEG